MSQAATAYAADLGYTTPLPEPCLGCGGPWYLKGYIGMATPDVDGIFDELLLTSPELVVYDKDIKSTPLFGIGFGYDTGHWFRFDITGEYRGDAVFFANAKYAGPNGGFTFDDGTRPTSRAGSVCSTPISISAPGIASRPILAAASASPRSRWSV